MDRSFDWTPAGIATLGFIVLLAIAWETLRWRRKPVELLRAMVVGRDWQKWRMGLKELKRRGEDIEFYVPLLLDRMLREKLMRREAARMTLSDLYPHLRPELRGISAADTPDAVRAKIAPLLERYPLPDPASTDVSTSGFVL